MVSISSAFDFLLSQAWPGAPKRYVLSMFCSPNKDAPGPKLKAVWSVPNKITCLDGLSGREKRVPGINRLFLSGDKRDMQYRVVVLEVAKCVIELRYGIHRC
jgi:hypothetical protein